MVSAAGTGDAGRIVAVDLARSAALLGMAVFHFTWDLELFGHIPPGTTLEGGWAVFARLVAGSFLFLAGVSLVLAHGDGIRWRGFLRRLAMVAGAAAAITAATFLAMREAFIFFGILHAIAVASCLGLLFLRAPVWLTIAAAAAVWVLPDLARAPAFDPRWLAWTGLAQTPPRSFDLVPVAPWFAATLLGIAAARAGEAAGLWTRLRAAAPAGPVLSALAWPGRHSLAVYLLHQPVLIGLLWLFSRWAG
jgi:uncharacterized membrane protein